MQETATKKKVPTTKTVEHTPEPQDAVPTPQKVIETQSSEYTHLIPTNADKEYLQKLKVFLLEQETGSTHIYIDLH